MNKKDFIKKLEELLKIAVDCIENVRLIDSENLLISFKQGGTRKIRIAGDSHLAIIHDVTERLLF